MWAQERWTRWEHEMENTMCEQEGINWRGRHRIVWVQEHDFEGYRCELCPDKKITDLWRVHEHIRTRKHQNRVG